MLTESGWTDDLFPPEQSLRIYNADLAKGGYVALQVGDLGHSRGSNKENTDHAFNEQAASFFEAELKALGKPPASGSVTAYTQTCPKVAPGGGPFKALSWSALHPHKITFGSLKAQTVTSAGGVKQLRLRASSPVPLARDIHRGGSLIRLSVNAFRRRDGCRAGTNP